MAGRCAGTGGGLCGKVGTEATAPGSQALHPHRPPESPTPYQVSLDPYVEDNDSCRGTQDTPLSLGKGEPPHWVGPGQVERHPESSRKPHPIQAHSPAAARGPSSGPGTPPSGAGRALALNPATPALPLTPPGGGRPAHAQPATGGCAAPAPGSGHLSTEQGAWLA